jgi:hypothetical protein
VARDTDASGSCTGRCDITQPSSRITSTSDARSGAGPDRPLNWPLPGAESPSAGAPPPRGPWWAGTPNEPARALGEGRGGPMLARPSSPLPVAALRPQS